MTDAIFFDILSVAFCLFFFGYILYATLDINT